MAERDESGRSSIAAAMTWVNQITGVALTMAVPTGLGYLLDDWWGTLPWVTCLGAVIGFAAGMQQLMGMARRAEERAAENKAKRNRDR